MRSLQTIWINKNFQESLTNDCYGYIYIQNNNYYFICGAGCLCFCFDSSNEYFDINIIYFVSSQKFGAHIRKGRSLQYLFV